jgi:hypothetical protein
MMRRRAIAVVAALAFVVANSAAFAQQAKPDNKKRSKQEQAEIEQLVEAVDGVMEGKPAPSDVQMTLTPYFLKSQEQRTFVPFVLELKGAPQADAAVYVRVVNSTSSAQADPKKDEDKDKDKDKSEYPWDDIHFVQASALNGGKLNRVFMAAPGTYDVYVAFKERLPEKAPKSQAAKMGVLKTQVTVPDFWNGELATSSILVTDKVNTINGPLDAEESRERPFVFGTQELVPASDMEFAKNEQLATFFQVYNAGLGSDGKPDLVMEYNFHRKEGGAEKFFNKTNPQPVNASNLPPTFDPAKFPVPGGIEVPLTSFPEGDYRLEIKITDKAGGKTVTKDVNFSVKGA